MKYNETRKLNLSCKCTTHLTNTVFIHSVLRSLTLKSPAAEVHKYDKVVLNKCRNCSENNHVNTVYTS